MSNKNKTIHEFDFNFICEYFSRLERQGPGSPEATLKALDFIDNLTGQSRIADLGCGTADRPGRLPHMFREALRGLTCSRISSASSTARQHSQACRTG